MPEVPSNSYAQIVTGSFSDVLNRISKKIYGDPEIKKAAAQPAKTECTPCMLSAQKVNAVSDSKVPLNAQEILDEYNNYRLKNALLPKDEAELNDFIAGKFAGIKKINKELAKPGENKYPMRPFWVKDQKAKKSYQAFTTLFQNIGLAEVYMPGAETPVCDNTHFTSILQSATLTSLKAAGVDLVIIVVPDSVDVATAWGAKKLAEAGLSHLMPNNLNELDVNQRLELHPTMPRIIMMAEKDLARTNELGLVKTDGGRLLLTNERAFTIYDRSGILKHLEKAPDAGLNNCIKYVTGDKILTKAQTLNLAEQKVPQKAKL